MARIFINYRREDSAAHAGRLYDRLSADFGQDQVFMDVDAIRPGEDFVDTINQRLSQCRAVLAVIGREWLTCADKDGSRRLDNPDDFVRQELRTALERQIRIIPVLVGGASMPRSRDLPADLEALARRNAVELSDARFHDNASYLTTALRDLLAPPPEPSAAEHEIRALRLRLVQCLQHRVQALRQNAKPPAAPAPKRSARTAPARSQRAAKWRATVTEQGWGLLTLRVQLSYGSHLVKFENLGSEKQVKVDGKIVARVGVGSLYTFRSKFTFAIADGRIKRRAALDYELGLTGTIKGLRLTVENQVLYSEGK